MGHAGKIAAFVLSPPLVAYVANLLRDYGASARRIRLLDEETKRVAYWKSAKESSLGTVREKNVLQDVTRELRRSSSLVTQAYRHWPLPTRWTRQKYGEYLASRSWISRRLLLHTAYSERSRRLAALWHVTIIVTFVVWVLGMIAAYRIHLSFKDFFRLPATSSAPFYVMVVVCSQIGFIVFFYAYLVGRQRFWLRGLRFHRNEPRDS